MIDFLAMRHSTCSNSLNSKHLFQNRKNRKVSKFSNARKLCCNLSQIQTKRPDLRIFCENDANGIAKSEDPDQTASSLIWVCTVCPDLSVRKLRVITVQKIH